MSKLLYIFFASTILIFSISCSHSASKKDFTIIAHRGASGYAPEHSSAAVAMAHAMNPDYIEPDLVLTKDDKLIVIHDIHLESTTNIETLFPHKKRKDGRYYAVDFTLKQIKQLQLNERETETGLKVFSERFSQGPTSLSILTFSEYVALIEGLNQSRKKNIGIYPEIKSPEFHLKEGKDILKIFLAEYDRLKIKMPLILQCFHAETLIRLKTEFPQYKFLRIQLIADNNWNESSNDYLKMQSIEGLKKISTYANGIGPWIPQLIIPQGTSYTTTKLSRDAKSTGLLVHPYTVRDDSLPVYANSSKELLDILYNTLRVDGVFTDFPDTGVAYKTGDLK